MPLEEVQAYAKSLGIKKVDSETLVYDILDQQATIASANTGASKASEPKKRKSATVATKKADAAKPKQEKKVEDPKETTEVKKKATKKKAEAEKGTTKAATEEKAVKEKKSATATKSKSKTTKTVSYTHLPVQLLPQSIRGPSAW